LFTFLTPPAPWVFSRKVVDGWQVVKRIEACGRYDGPKKGIPRTTVTITDAGVLEDDTGS